MGEHSLDESDLSMSPHTHLQSGHSYRSFLSSEAPWLCNLSQGADSPVCVPVPFTLIVPFGILRILRCSRLAN